MTTLGELDLDDGRHAHAADRRLLDDARDRLAGTTATGAPRGVHAAALPGVKRAREPRAAGRASASRAQASASATVATLATSGRAVGARRSPAGRDRRAASSLACVYVAAAVLGDDELDPVPVDQLPARRRACTGRGRAAARARGGSGGSGGSTQRIRNHASLDARERSQALAAGRQQHAPAERAGSRGGRPLEVVDPVPAVAGAARSSPGARSRSSGTSAARARRGRRGRDPLGERMRGVDDRGHPRAPSASRRARRDRRSRRCAPPRAAGADATRGRRASEVTAHAARRPVRRELARLGGAAEHEDHGHCPRGRSSAAHSIAGRTSLLVIGIGAGDPEHVTVQAVRGAERGRRVVRDRAAAPTS